MWIPGTECEVRINEWTADDGVAVSDHFMHNMADDFLILPSGNCYLIEEWKPARAGSRSRGRFRCVRLEKGSVELGDDGVWPMVWSKAK